ncbi:MAG: GNAT family N-acetyltransferase [Paracoccaceae bacterium]
MPVRVQLGLPPDQRAVAARLYWQAFGGKLGLVLGPERRALQFLERVMRADHVIVALDDAQLIGLAGFKSPRGSFAGGDMAALVAVYGWGGALWRAGLLSLLERDVDNERFLLDGICVAAEARSQGVGAALLNAIADEARQRGYEAVRLDVVEDNFRAKALYQRLGFEVVGTQRLGLLRYVFGFAAVTTMVRTVAGG